jgi:UDP-N-acetylmuramate dehydrogenase
MRIEKKYNIKSLNTFAIDTIAEEVMFLEQKEDFADASKLIANSDVNHLILGGGSNILFTKDFNGILISIENKGIKIVEDGEYFALVSFSAGENWHNSVEYCVHNGYYGLENLALIPGKIGAAPVQNIGAYGIEQCDFLHSVKAFFDGEEFEFLAEDLKFGYRNSIFKDEKYKKYIIYEVTYKLHKDKEKINTSYKDIREFIQKKDIIKPQPIDIFHAIINIRQAKLPDPAIIGNAGSFFKNPVYDAHLVSKLQIKYPDMPVYSVDDHHSKISAAYLIDKAGFKGFRKNDAGVFNKHALILCNFGNASGKEIFNLSEEIIHKVREIFGVTLEREVILV